MSQQTFNVSENGRIEIRNCHDRVTVIGWDEAQRVSVDYAARQEGDTIIVENADRVTLRVPRRAAVKIEDCEADVRVEDLDGRVELVHIGGDVSLQHLRGEALARDVDGDLAARDVASLKGGGSWDGDVALRGAKYFQAEEIKGDASLAEVEAIQIRTVGGDVNLRGGAGRVAIDRVGGDLIASGLQNTLKVTEIEGDAVISVAEIAEVELRAEGDVVINLPEAANAEIELDAPHGDLIAHADIQVIEEDESHVHGTLGHGGTKIRAASSKGDLVLRAGGAGRRFVHAEAYAEMGQRIAQEVRESMRDSFQGWRAAAPPKIKIKKHWGRWQRMDDEDREEEKTRGPAAGSSERKAILDAIARGELSVDDAIQKLRGKE